MHFHLTTDFIKIESPAYRKSKFQLPINVKADVINTFIIIHNYIRTNYYIHYFVIQL